MPDNPLSFFHAESLRQRFAEDLASARLAGRVSTQQSQWLLRVFEPPGSIAQPTDSPRVDRLLIADESASDIDLASAWLISHPSSSAHPIYFSSLCHGLEPFDNREQLLHYLEAHYPVIARVQSGLESEKIEGDVFQQRSWAIIDHQAGQLARGAEQLLQLPSLQWALNQALKRQIEARIPGISVDPAIWLSQIIETAPATLTQPQAPNVVGLQTLQDAVLDAFSGQALDPRLTRYFLNSQGQVVDASHARLYQQALSATPQCVSQSYEALLGDFWCSANGDGRSRQDDAAGWLAQAFFVELLAKRHSGLLTQDEFLGLRLLVYPVQEVMHAVAQVHIEKLSVAIAPSEPVMLAGMFLIRFAGDTLSEPLLYSSTRGLRRVSAHESLSDYFKTTIGQQALLDHASLNDHALLRTAGTLGVREDELTDPLFLDCAGSVIALQKRNLAFALTQPRQALPRASVMLDDALDIRRLLDHRLLRISTGERWREGGSRFDSTWLTAQDNGGEGLNVSSRAPASLSWLEHVDTLDNYCQRIRSAHPGVERWVTDQLNLYLAVILDVQRDVRYLQVQLNDGTELPTMESPRAERVSLITLTLEWLSGLRTEPVPDASRVLFTLPSDNTSQPLVHLAPAVLNRVLARVRDDFAHRWSVDVLRFYNRPSRQKDTQWVPAALACSVREEALRLELFLQQRLGTVDAHLLSLMEQVLSLPTRALRHPLGDTAADVYSLSLRHDPRQPAVAMSNAFIIQRAVPAPGKLLMWSSLQGLREFDSFADLSRDINRQLVRRDQRESWLGLLSAPEQQPVRRWLEHTDGRQVSIVTHRIEGHFVQHVQQAEWVRQYRGVEQVVQWALKRRLAAATFANLLNGAEQDDGISQALSGLSQRIQHVMFTDVLPDWLRSAPVADLKALCDSLRRYYLTNDPSDDFLADIPGLQDYARDLLRAELNKDFPDLNLQPDEIVIRFNRYIDSTAASALPGALGQTPSWVPVGVVAHTENLTDYAINRFANAQDVWLSVTTSSSVPLPPLITPQYLNAVIHHLDVGATFRQRVAQTLDIKAPGHARRLTGFIRQTPALMLMQAYVLKLAGALTDTAYRFIKCVVDMPDGIARLKLGDQDIVLRPIQLVASQGMAPDTVPGLYLIGPRTLTEGPQILHAILNKDLVFKEYPDQGALLKDIRESASLQTIILQRVDPDVRARYAEGGFASVHLNWFSQHLPNVTAVLPGAMHPVTLGDSTDQGNALQTFFTDTLSVYQSQIRQHTMTSAEVDRRSSRYLITLGAEQVLSFLPGKLGLAIAAWQSQTLFSQAVVAASRQRWGKAVSEFIAALSVLIGAREGSKEGAEGGLENQSPTVPEPLPEHAFSWRDGRLTPELQSRLRRFEVNAVLLSTLQHDELLNLYRDPPTHHQYAAVAGKVYRVSEVEGALRIVGDEETGPRIKLNKDTRQWALDLDLGLRGGGANVTRMSTAFTDINVDDLMVVEAEGMPTIRFRYIDKARRIGQAHLQAKRYLEVAMDNLAADQPDGALHPDVAGIIGRFFGVQTPSATLVNKVQHQIRSLFAAIVDSSLSAFSSPRFVVGTNRMGYEDNVAFVFDTDPLKRIYLTEQFFRPPRYSLKAPTAGQASFNTDAHFRAMTLIHEISHLACDTHDITYVEATAPYPELLEDHLPGQARVKENLLRLQQRGLSHQTPMDELFQTIDDNGWRDLNTNDGSAKRALLRITGQSDLQGARRVFMADSDKRSDVMLSNADSLSLLVSLLGRRALIEAS